MRHFDTVAFSSILQKGLKVTQAFQAGEIAFCFVVTDCSAPLTGKPIFTVNQDALTAVSSLAAVLSNCLGRYALHPCIRSHR